VPEGLWLRNARTGRRERLPIGGSRLLRIHVAAPASDLDTVLRPLLVADLIRRFAELQGAQAVVTAPSPVPDAAAFNVHPPQIAPAPAPADVLVGDLAAGALSVAPGPLTGSLTAAHPLAARLLLLSAPHAVSVAVDPVGAAIAAERLARWRGWVRRDAAAPSAALPAGYAATALERATDELDTASIVALLNEIGTDGSIARGARFEFFMWADRLLGLDLAAGLWNLPPAQPGQ
jgi:hypothetical protein